MVCVRAKGVQRFFIMIDARKACGSQAEADEANAAAREVKALFERLDTVECEVLVSTTVTTSNATEAQQATAATIPERERDLVKEYMKFHDTQRQWNGARRAEATRVVRVRTRTREFSV